MTLTERAAYLKGLADGLALDEAKPEAKLLKEVISIIEDLANDVTAIAEDIQDLGDYCEELDEDLGAVEEELYGDECDCCDCDDDFDDEDYEIECPACGALLALTEEDDPSDLVCPECGEHFDCECDGCCDDCGGCGEDEE